MYWNHPELRVAQKNAEKMSGKVETRPTEKGDFWKDFVAGREAPWNLNVFWEEKYPFDVMRLYGCIIFYDFV